MLTIDVLGELSPSAKWSAPKKKKKIAAADSSNCLYIVISILYLHLKGMNLSSDDSQFK